MKPSNASRSSSRLSVLMNCEKISTWCPLACRSGSSLLSSMNLPLDCTSSLLYSSRSLRVSFSTTPRIMNGWLQHLRSSV